MCVARSQQLMLPSSSEIIRCNSAFLSIAWRTQFVAVAFDDTETWQIPRYFVVVESVI